MSRIRSTHPTQWTDEAFVECSAFARLLALGLRNEADDHGIFEWKPVTLKMRLLPADNVDVGALLGELIATNQVKQYAVDGRQYGMIRNFGKFQSPRRPSWTHPKPASIREWFEFTGQYGDPPKGIEEPIPDNVGNDRSDGEGIGIGEGIGVNQSLARAREGTSPKQLAPEQALEDAAFERFYTAYPKHEAKGAARRAWRTARKQADAELLIQSAKDYSVRRVGQDPQFTPQPSAWLNKERWKDEPSPEFSNAPHQRNSAKPAPLSGFAQAYAEAVAEERGFAGTGEAPELLLPAGH